MSGVLGNIIGETGGVMDPTGEMGREREKYKSRKKRQEGDDGETEQLRREWREKNVGVKKERGWNTIMKDGKVKL